MGRVWTASGSTQPLRFVALRNLSAIGTQTMTGTVLSFTFNYPYVIGSGDASSIKLSFSNYFMQLVGAVGAGGGGELNTGNAVMLDTVALWTGSVTTPVTFGGGRTLTLNDGDVNIRADSVFPQSLSLSKFAQASTVWVKGTGHVASAGQFIPIGRSPLEATGAQATMFDPAATTLSSTDAVGVYTNAGGAALTGMTYGFTPFMLGTFVSGSPKVYLYACDSLGDGHINFGAKPYSNGLPGLMQNAVVNSDGVTSPFAFAQIGAPGMPYAAFTTTNSPSEKWHNFIPYATVGICELGGNASPESNFTQVWSDWYTYGIKKLLVCNLTPTSNSSDSWATVANQFQPPSPQANSNRDTDHAFVASKVGTGAFDYYYDFPEYRNTPTDLGLIAVNGTASYATYDGIHPQQTMSGPSGLITNAVRTLLATIPAP